MGRRRRKSRINNCDLVDRISPLPDSVLSLILSFLPTKNAVATSVLSKSWKFAWVTLHNLDFYHDGYLKRYSEGENMKFVRFVNRVLLLHDAILLKRFHLSWMYGCNSSHVTSWINTAIRKNVHELSLWLDTPPKSPSTQIELPISVFNCASLRSLDLIFPIYFSTAMVGCLPRLESLRLSSVHFESEEACEKLISACPMLRYLRLNISFTCDDDDYFTCIISSASLKHLDMSLNYKIILKLKASSLENLWLNGDVSRIFVEKSLRSLVQANFNIKVDEPDLSKNSIVETVRALDCAKSLAFSGRVMRALTCATVRLSTKFERLVKLVGGPLCNSLLDFIQSSDNLQVLIIHQHSNWLGMSGFHDQSNWIAPVEVPRCVSTSLKKVVLDGYYGNEDEHEMIRYMLKHGSALEVMQISCDKNVNDKEFELLQTICEFPRTSPACEVQLSEWASTKFKHLY